MTTGGPEALHQFVAHMRNLDLPAYICYMPFDKPAKTPDVYLKYKAPTIEYEDAVGNLIIFAEVFPMLAKKVRFAQAAIWWLSLENFLERRHVSALRDKLRYFRKILRGQRPILGARSLRELLHFSQTEHSTQYLLSCGIEPIPLIDSINEVFLNRNYKNYQFNKKNIILYNPTKGKQVTSRLMQKFKNYQFIPLQGLSPEQISARLYEAKLYIDFGHHPGRDRMPREAAMHGCCIVSGLLGSAGNNVDLPIPKEYKLDSSDPLFLEKFSELVDDIFVNFNQHTEIFEGYRDWLINEPTVFKQQIRNYFLGDHA